MSAVITTLPDGRRRVTCATCHAEATTGFLEVARQWARKHVCPRKGDAA